MKNIIILVLVVFMVSCGLKSDNQTKKNELAKLKTELKEIQNKIASLEKELANEKDGSKGFKFPVSVKTIQPEAFNHYIELSGNIEALNAAFISSEIPGQIKAIYVNEGERVEKDQLLAKLNTTSIEKGIDELKTSLDLATTIYQKQKNLWDQKIGSEVDFLTAKNNKEGLERKLESLKAQLDLTYIKAPFKGIVDDIILKVGELASPGIQIMQMVNLDKLYINVDVAESYLPVIQKGDKVEISFPSFPELSMQVPIHRIGNMIHPLNRTFSIQLKINNNKEMLKPNGLALIKVNDFSAADAIVVPSIIIKQDMQGSFLYVAEKQNKGWAAKKRYVSQGISYKDQSMIVKGLSNGEKVVVEGYNQISDGSEVVIK